MENSGTPGRIELRRIIFAKPVETIGWGGQRMRVAVDDKDAKIELDFANRIWRCTPKRETAEVLEGPFENLTGWKRKVAKVEKAPEPETEPPQRAWTRKPPKAPMKKPKAAAAPAPEPAAPTETP